MSLALSSNKNLAKGVDELTIVATTPAILNAIYDAVGVTLLPLKIYSTI